VPGFSGSGAIQRPYLEPTASPGPKYLFVDHTQASAPNYSLAGRAAIAKIAARSPGPTYNPNSTLIGNITQTRAGAFSLGARAFTREAGDEPGPGAFEVGQVQMDATRHRSPSSSIHIRYSDRKGKLKVPKADTPGPETSKPDLPGCIGSGLSIHGGFNRGPGHADAVMNMSLPGTDRGFTMSMIIP
jgi:hypothetical protein